MKTDAFEGNETVERFGDALRYVGGEPAAIPIERLSVAEFVAKHPEYAEGTPVSQSPTYPITDDDRYQFYCEPCGRAFRTAEQQASHACVGTRDFCPNLIRQARDDGGFDLLATDGTVVGGISAPVTYPDLQAVDRDARLKACGLVWYEDQLSSRRFVAPSGKPQSSESRLKVLPLYMVQPVPGLEIEAMDGEKYILPPDFKGDWFSVTSPTGKPLIGE